MINALKRQAKELGLKIDFINYGLASRVGDTILLNKNMLKYPSYCKEIMDHELRHSSKFTKKDIVMDLTEGSFIKNMTFSLKHPKAFLQLIPIQFYKGNLLIDLNLMLSYVIGIAALCLFFWVIL